MLLYLLRHGIAEDHGSRGSDAERELTDEGKEKTRLAMQALRAMRLAVPALVMSSPYTRARQTAEIALEEFAKDALFEISTSLVPSADITVTMNIVAEAIKRLKPVMLVGHEPHLSSFGSALLGSPTPIIEMKKASVAKFEIYKLDPTRMRGALTALIPPKIGSLL